MCSVKYRFIETKNIWQSCPTESGCLLVVPRVHILDHFYFSRVFRQQQYHCAVITLVLRLFACSNGNILQLVKPTTRKILLALISRVSEFPDDAQLLASVL